MDNFRIRPLFFSIRDDSYAAVRRWNNRQITYNILKNVRPVHRNLSRQMNNKIGHGDGNTIPGDSTTKLSDEESATDVINRNLNTEGIIYKNIPISRTENGARDEVEQIIYEGQIAPNVSGTFSKIETYRSLWIPVHSELMSRTYRTTEVSGEALLLESIKRSSIHGTVPVGVKQFKPRSSEVDATERIMLRILQTVMTDRDLSETLKKTRLSDKLETDLSKLQEQNERNAILIRSTQQYARITRKHNTIGSGVKEGSLVESPKLQKGNRNSLAEVGDNETTGTKKGRNFLKVSF
ncbi:hypothetical protein SNE40_022745 [Patella caerulea]|uniref:Uncharacterized protein n=1 Tax=Patella caerulea TaxID=87958 RepID=A0AAN8GFY9_PATCE